MSSFFWPKKQNSAPTVLTRLGRVLHWIGAGLGAAATVIALGVALTRPDDARVALAFFGSAAALSYVAGRALRYILSAE